MKSTLGILTVCLCLQTQTHSFAADEQPCLVEFQQHLRPRAVGPFDYFGESLAMSGNRCAIAAPGSRPQSVIYLYERAENGSWYQTDQINPSRGFVSRFGFQLAMDGTTLVSLGYLENEGGDRKLLATVYEYDGSRWAESELNFEKHPTDIEYYANVTVQEDTILVAFPEQNAQGVVYEFTKQEDDWKLGTIFYPNSEHNAENFGRSLALHGNSLAISSEERLVESYPEGAVYIYKREGSRWTQTHYLSGEDIRTQPIDAFASVVALSDRFLVTSATPEAFDRIGKAVIFERFGSEWQLFELVEQPIELDRSYFGQQINLLGDVMIIGAPSRFGTPDEAYSYRYNPGAASWEFHERFRPPGIYGTVVGTAVGFNGQDIILGSWEQIEWSGAAGAFTIDCQPLACPLDLNGDERLDIYDVFVFLDAYTSEDPLADFSGDGKITITDYFYFIVEFNELSPGCG